jgi:putative ABC transport system permease protein
MGWFETLRSAAEAIVGHRSRSLLTVLGILIGIAAVILTVGLGEGATSKVTSAISSLGTNLLTISPGSTSTGGVSQGLGSATTLTMADANALASKLDCPQIKAVAPTVQRTAEMVAGSSNTEAPVIGSTPSYLSVRSRTMAEGQFLTPAEVSSDSYDAVLGSEVASELFGGENPVGQTVTIAGSPFTVVGVMATAGGSSGPTGQDDQVIVPISTAQDLLTGDSGSLSSILVEATSGNTVGAAYDEANDLLLQLHGITSPAEADFTITPETQILSTASSVSKTLTILLTGVAAISLLVGGIGVMNIMLVSVTERIREIGLRKALGATPSVILRQFLAEATLLGLSGGVIGVGLGVLGAVLLPSAVGSPIVISVPAILLAVAISAAIGLGFGGYPASRAARLAPIEALRSE